MGLSTFAQAPTAGKQDRHLTDAAGGQVMNFFNEISNFPGTSGIRRIFHVRHVGHVRKERRAKSGLKAALLAPLLGCLVCWSSVAKAEGLDLALSNETANLFLILNPFSPRAERTSDRNMLRIAPRGSELSIGAFINETGDSLLHATIMARGVNVSKGTQYKLGAGMKAVGGDLEIDEKVSALALGFQASVLLGYADTNPIDFTVEGFLAPSITSFSDAEQFTELAARLQVEVIGQARAYLGYRRITFDTNDFGEQRLDRGVHLGLNITF